ncbi:MAG: P-loop NTPase [Oscillospiraceae bacterium]|nr:P-loop NTPase [Clostridia bacterium]MBQ8883214.1 P-loop NTPase [Oscillospiraceae bacterium]
MAKIFTVLSGKGGVGKSTLCVNIALSLCQKGKKVLLIDGDISLRSLDMLLGLDGMVLYDWSDVLENRCDTEKARLFYDDNLQLLPAPLEHPESLSEESFKVLLSQYSDSYDYIFIDSPAGVGKLPMIYAKCAGQCIVVATPDNVSARSAGVMGNELVKSGIEDQNIKLVINRFDPLAVVFGKYLNVDEIIDITYLSLLGVIPEEKRMMYASVNDKELPSRCKAKICFSNIAERISGKDIPLNL